LLSGVSLDGKGFFYPNPLESNGQHSRSPWFGVACCPGNITRFLASVPGYIYAQAGNTIYLSLFAAGSADITLDQRHKVRLTQATRYPWDGKIKLTVSPTEPGEFTLRVRIPGWAREQVVPSDLYSFVGPAKEAASLKVNGQRVPLELEKGFANLTRTWHAGDVMELDLPMPIRRVVAKDNVQADRGRVALERGPLVYCAEWPDNPEGKVRNLLLPDDQPLTAEFEPALLNGVEAIKGKAYAVSTDETGALLKALQDFKAIPYFAWANRGRGQMAVWIADSEKSVRVPAKPTVASKSRVSVSGNGKNPRAINDQMEPSSSNDAENSFFHWWPRKGTEEWVEYAFAAPATVSQTEVYWFDDTGTGECRVPASWRVLYKDGESWKPVESTDAYGVLKDQFNKVSFKPVNTTGMRLEVQLQPRWSAGIQEWKVQ
jgi:hypothetical protein